ncbi:MAG: hypothetical protein ABUT39_19740 [Acidobacteriota bacterium]
MNKPFLAGMVILALVLFAIAPAAQAQAQCSGYYCEFENCFFYDQIADGTFSFGCPNWGYAGTAGVTLSNMCGYPNNVAYISRNLYSTGGVVAQVFSTSNDFLDEYSFEYFVETSNMQPGDKVDVYVIESNGYPPQWHLVDTITTNVSCLRRVHHFTNPGWKGHLMWVRFEGNFGSTSTSAYIDYVAFWQKTY